jgi:hypothetical protein
MKSIGNPLFWRDRQLFRRVARTRVATYLGVILVPMVSVELMCWLECSNASGSFADIHEVAWFLSGLLWLFSLTLQTLAKASSVYERERDLGALPLVTLTAIRPHDEVRGRFMGSLLAPGAGWMCGLLLLLLAPVHHGAGPGWAVGGGPGYGQLFALWLTCGLWMLTLAAMGLYFASFTKGAASAFMGVTCTVFGCFLIYPTAIVYLSSALPVSLGNMAAQLLVNQRYLSIPPLPSLFLPYLSDPWSWSWNVFFLQLTVWLSLIVAALGGALYQVRRGRPLAVKGRAAEGPRGLVPTAAPPPVVTGVRPPPGTIPSHPLSFIADFMLKPFERNPYYVAYRRGYLRLYAGQVTNAPGSALPPGLLICAIVTYACIAAAHTDLTDVAVVQGAGTMLLVVIGFASLISALQATALAIRSLSSERDQATWPLLVVTGMQPSRVLGGKFAAAFYSVSGEWLFPLPAWVFAALISGRPLLLLLALVHPAATAAGVLAGLTVASQTSGRMSMTRVVLGLFVIAILLLWGAFNPVTLVYQWMLYALDHCNLFAAAWLVTGGDLSEALGGAIQLCIGAGAAALAAMLGWRLALGGMKKVMTQS